MSNINEQIEKTNEQIEQLQKKDIVEPNPVELVMQMQGQKQSIWNKVNVLKDTATAVSYLQSNNITTLAQLDEKGKSVNSQFHITRKELIGVENKISELSETINQTDIVAYR